MEHFYDKDYYEHGVAKGISGYDHYRWLPELTLPMAHELVVQLGIKKTDKILDYGCAKGYLVKALRMLHYDAWGTDISRYAIESAPLEVIPFLTLLDATTPLEEQLSRYDWVLSKDVLEHVPYAVLPSVLKGFRAITKNAFVAVPLGDGKQYNIPEYENDITHIIREDMRWWENAFKDAGFSVVKAEYKMPHIKANWEHHKNGNGFFVLR